MDVPLYDVYLTGKFAEDVNADLAAQRLAVLFKSTPAAMSTMLTGKAHLLKRGIDKNTALKYREVLQNAGLEVAFKAQTTAPAAAGVIPQPVESPAAAATAPAAAAPGSGTLQLAPAGADVLSPDERHHATAARVDTSHLSIAPAGPLPATPAVSVPAPAVDHLSLAAAGSDLLDADERVHPPLAVPDTSALELAPPEPPVPPLRDLPPPPDISALQLAPAGSELLTDEQRRHPAPPAPNTDHIRLAE